MNKEYKNLISDCKEIITEYEFTSRWSLIEGYHALGERISKEENVIMTQLAEDLNKSVRTIQRSVQFYKMYPNLNMLPEGKNVSWYLICNKYLTSGKKKKTDSKKSYIECPKCHYRWTG
jgi:hypothetical protein